MFVTAPSGSPGEVTASEVKAIDIIIHWTEISCIDRNGDITGYRILYGPANTESLMIFSLFTSHVFTNLSPFTNYSFSVSGENGEGAGPFSDAAIFRTSEDRE